MYQAQILGGLVDEFGNTMAPSAVYTFIWSGGTDGADVFRLALDPNTLDYQVFLNDDNTPAFLAGQGTAKIVLAGGLDNDSLTIDFSGGDPMTPAGVVFDGGDGTDTLGMNGTSSDDVATFDDTSVEFNGALPQFSSVEQYAYDGKGGNDTLTVLAKTVTFDATQTFDSLQIGNGAASGLHNGRREASPRP